MLFSLPESLLLLRQHLAQFAPLSDEDWHLLEPHVRLASLPKHGLFAQEGRVAGEVAFVLEGMFRQFYTKDGEERTTYFFFENHLLSAYFSCLTGQPSRLTIEALTESHYLSFPYAVLAELFEQRMAWQKFGRRLAEYLTLGLEERMVSLLLLSPEERYRELLASGKTKILARVPQHYIANYLGMTPVSLSRIRSRTRRGG